MVTVNEVVMVAAADCIDCCPDIIGSTPNWVIQQAFKRRNGFITQGVGQQPAAPVSNQRCLIGDRQKPELKRFLADPGIAYRMIDQTGPSLPLMEMRIGFAQIWDGCRTQGAKRCPVPL